MDAIDGSGFEPYIYFKETLNNSSLNCQSPETENAIFGFLTKSIPYGD
jgi:hypothetical protein